MSHIHRVILLHKPLKIRLVGFSFSVGQWIAMALSVALGFVISFNCIPQGWKLLGAPLGVFVFVSVVGGMIGVIKACEMKPPVWWRNLIAYRLKLLPSVYLPHPEPKTIYPDPTIIEVEKEDNNYAG